MKKHLIDEKMLFKIGFKRLNNLAFEFIDDFTLTNIDITYNSISKQLTLNGSGFASGVFFTFNNIKYKHQLKHFYELIKEK